MSSSQALLAKLLKQQSQRAQPAESMTCSNQAESQQTISKFPLKYLLYIYIKANKLCYINYFARFKALIAWLGPIDIPSDSELKFMPMLYGYEIQEISTILKCHPSVIQHTLLEIYKELKWIQD